MIKTKQQILERDNYTCQRCGKKGIDLQLAHRVKQGKGTIRHIQNYIRDKHKIFLNKKYAEKIIHDELNLVSSCPGACNDSFNIFFKPVKRDELIDKIYENEFIEVINEREYGAME